MKSTWVAAGLLLLTICQAAKAEPTPESPSIIRISRKIPDNNEFYVCLDNYVLDAKKYELVIHDHNITTYETDPPIASECLLFQSKTSITTWDTVNLDLKVETKSEGTISGKKIWNLSFPEFPVDGELHVSRADDPQDNTKQMLRAEGDLNGFTFDVGVPVTSALPKLVKYYLGLDNFPEPLYLCAVPVDAVSICDQLNPGDLVNTPGPTVDSAILSYDSDDEATVSVTVSEPTAGSTSLEIIVTDGDDKLQLFISNDIHLLKSDLFQWKNQKQKILKIRLVGIKGNMINEINTNPIHDRGMTITKFNGGVLEGTWQMLDDASNRKYYRLTKKNTAENSENDVYVDCAQVTLEHCFGYFTGLIESEYTLTVTNIMTTSEDYNEGEQIESIRTKVTPTIPQQHLQIHDLPMEWHQNLMEVNTTICFSHETPNEEMIFSHYEMLLINTRGQWIKHKVMEEDDNDDVLCFTPFTINTQEFDVTEGVKVVVSQRASDGVSVIASGGSPLF